VCVCAGVTAWSLGKTLMYGSMLLCALLFLRMRSEKHDRADVFTGAEGWRASALCFEECAASLPRLHASLFQEIAAYLANSCVRGDTHLPVEVRSLPGAAAPPPLPLSSPSPPPLRPLPTPLLPSSPHSISLIASAKPMGSLQETTVVTAMRAAHVLVKPTRTAKAQGQEALPLLAPFLPLVRSRVRVSLTLDTEGELRCCCQPWHDRTPRGAPPAPLSRPSSGRCLPPQMFLGRWRLLCLTLEVSWRHPSLLQ
jgi:hypothetical protein